MKFVDEYQCVVLGIDSLPIQDTETIKTEKIFDYYKLDDQGKDYKPENIEINSEFKMRQTIKTAIIRAVFIVAEEIPF